MELRDDRAAARDDPVGQAGMGAREEPAVAAAEDGDGRDAGRDAGRVRRTVDAHREAGHDRRARVGQGGRDPGREASPELGRPARADDRDGVRALHGRRVATHEQQVRRQLDREEPPREQRVSRG